MISAKIPLKSEILGASKVVKLAHKEKGNPLSLKDYQFDISGAGNEIRTHDPHLGKKTQSHDNSLDNRMLHNSQHKQAHSKSNHEFTRSNNMNSSAYNSKDNSHNTTTTIIEITKLNIPDIQKANLIELLLTKLLP